MENTIVEQLELQPEDNLETSPEVVTEDSTREEDATHGNFGSTEELYRSYRVLHSEFTRKSQELAALKKSMEAPEAPKTEVVTQPLPQTGEDKQKVIYDYLVSLASQQTAPAVITSGGQAQLRKIDAPKSMLDAQADAKHYFETHRR